MAVKVMITDDHSLIREGLKQLLELEGDFQVIAEACDGIDCMEKLKEQRLKEGFKIAYSRSKTPQPDLSAVTRLLQ